MNQSHGGSTSSVDMAYSIRSKRRPKSSPSGPGAYTSSCEKYWTLTPTATFHKRYGKDLGHLSTLQRRRGVVVQHERRAGRHIGNRRCKPGRGGDPHRYPSSRPARAGQFRPRYRAGRPGCLRYGGGDRWGQRTRARSSGRTAPSRRPAAGSRTMQAPGACAHRPAHPGGRSARLMPSSYVPERCPAPATQWPLPGAMETAGLAGLFELAEQRHLTVEPDARIQISQ